MRRARVGKISKIGRLEGEPRVFWRYVLGLGLAGLLSTPVFPSPLECEYLLEWGRDDPDFLTSIVKFPEDELNTGVYVDYLQDRGSERDLQTALAIQLGRKIEARSRLSRFGNRLFGDSEKRELAQMRNELGWQERVTLEDSSSGKTYGQRVFRNGIPTMVKIVHVPRYGWSSDEGTKAAFRVVAPLVFRTFPEAAILVTESEREDLMLEDWEAFVAALLRGHPGTIAHYRACFLSCPGFKVNHALDACFANCVGAMGDLPIHPKAEAALRMVSTELGEFFKDTGYNRLTRFFTERACVVEVSLLIEASQGHPFVIEQGLRSLLPAMEGSRNYALGELRNLTRHIRSAAVRVKVFHAILEETQSDHVRELAAVELAQAERDQRAGH